MRHCFFRGARLAAGDSGLAGLARGASRAPEGRDEFAERRLVRVGNRDIGEVRVPPTGHVVAVDGFEAPGPASRAVS